jgi:multisubunit Na+/H+ antiporter MnhF subunit
MASNDQSRTTQFLSSTFALLAISWLVYFCRLYTRLHLVKRIFAEDIFVTIAMVRAARNQLQRLANSQHPRHP